MKEEIKEYTYIPNNKFKPLKLEINEELLQKARKLAYGNNSDQKKSYRVRGFRLNDSTWEKMKQKRGSVSWNKFLLDLIDKKK